MAGLCSIANCEKPVRQIGLCSSHYWRKRQHGDPLRGGTPKGETQRFYNEVVLTDERGVNDDCLIWRYARTGQGYAHYKKDGRWVAVHRRLCEETRGPAPTPEHEVAHSCGKGKQGCVTKSHVDWKTHPENEADKLTHGTLMRGERHYGAKLTEQQARKILSLKGQMTQREIGELCGASSATVHQIHAGKNWGWLNG